MSKKSPVLYMLLRPPLTAIFRLAVMPKIEGKENIPKNGAAVLAGNHTSSFDCFMLMSSTRRCIHFLAKDELFKGPLKYFFGGAGIIPVNRRQKDRAALSSAENYLKNDSIIGIFPEGTTKKSEDVTILPFKIGAVKMAYDTDTKIVPFTIKGKYKLFSRTQITFYPSVSIDSEDLTAENKRFEERICSLLEEVQTK